MNILDKIVQEKRKEVEQKKQLYPTALLEKGLFFENKNISMKDYILRDDKSVRYSLKYCSHLSCLVVIATIILFVLVEKRTIIPFSIK